MFVLLSVVSPSVFPFSYHICFFASSTFLYLRHPFTLQGLDQVGFCIESTVVCVPLIWDTALSEILDEGDTESEGNEEAGSSEEDEDDDEEEDEDGKCMIGAL